MRSILIKAAVAAVLAASLVTVGGATATADHTTSVDPYWCC